MNALGKYIKRRRQKLNLSVAYAARDAQISTQYWYMIENGRRHDIGIAVMDMIATTLQVATRDIITAKLRDVR